MKRNRFIASLALAAAAPLSILAQPRKTLQRKPTAFKAAAGEGRIHGHLKLKGVNANILDLKVSGSDTGGDLAIFEQTSVSQGRGTPLHVHFSQDEVFYVLEGSYRFKVGNDLHQLTAGDSIFLPRQVPHAWTQVSGTGKMLVLFQPAGKMEAFFVAMAALDHEPTQEEVARLFSAHDMRIVGPPLPLA